MKLFKSTKQHCKDQCCCGACAYGVVSPVPPSPGWQLSYFGHCRHSAVFLMPWRWVLSKHSFLFVQQNASATHIAVLQNFPALVKLLIDAECDLDIPDNVSLHLSFFFFPLWNGNPFCGRFDHLGDRTKEECFKMGRSWKRNLGNVKPVKWYRVLQWGNLLIVLLIVHVPGTCVQRHGIDSPLYAGIRWLKSQARRYSPKCLGNWEWEVSLKVAGCLDCL